MPDNSDELSPRRREAKLALGGDKLAAKEKLEEKRRQEAVAAMEGEQHRARREAKESASRTHVSASRATAELKARLAAEAQTHAAHAAAERAQKEEDALAAETGRHDKIKQSEELTEKLKSATTKLGALRTIKTDMARAVREGGLSLSKIAILSQERGRNDESMAVGEHNQTWLIISIILVVAVSGGLTAWWWIIRPAAPVASEQNILLALDRVFRADSNRPVNGDDLNTVSKARAALETAAEEKNEQGGLINIYVTKNNEVLTLLKFSQVIGLNLPENLTRHLQDNFAFGVYDGGETRSRFLILKTSFFAQAWSAMLEWERYLASDLGFLLKTNSDNKAVWLDKTLRNKDARLERDSDGRAILIYGFIDEQTILITRDENAFIKVFERLIEQG